MHWWSAGWWHSFCSTFLVPLQHNRSNNIKFLRMSLHCYLAISGGNTSLQFKHELQFMSSILLNILRYHMISKLGNVSLIQKTVFASIIKLCQILRHMWLRNWFIINHFYQVHQMNSWECFPFSYNIHVSTKLLLIMLHSYKLPVKLCCWVIGAWHFEFLCNTVNNLLSDTVSHPSRPESSAILLGEPQISLC